MAPDRRLLRSSSPAIAAEFYLEAQRSRSGAAAIVLVEDDRVLAACGRSPDDLETLAGSISAGVAPIGRDLYAHDVRAGAHALRLASLDARVPSVRAIERDLTRILAE